jgi:hypothetical protein
MSNCSLNTIIKRLIKQSNPASYTDLLILEKLGVQIDFPIKVPDSAVRQGKDQLLKTIQYYMKHWHNQTISIQQLQKKFIFSDQSGGFNSRHSLDTMFPEKEGIDYDKLKMTEEGEYSITRRMDGKRLLQKMISIVGSLKKKHITDLTGNVGGDTILFGLNCKTVDSIEYNKENFEALENNVKVFGLDNVKVHFGDSTKLYKWYTDVLYIDPPWGGPDYKEKVNLDLFLGDVRVDLYLKDVLSEEWRPSYVFLKLPRNYHFKRLDRLPNIKKAHKFAIRNFSCVALEVS